MKMTEPSTAIKIHTHIRTMLNVARTHFNIFRPSFSKSFFLFSTTNQRMEPRWGGNTKLLAIIKLLIFIQILWGQIRSRTSKILLAADFVGCYHLTTLSALAKWPVYGQIKSNQRNIFATHPASYWIPNKIRTISHFQMDFVEQQITYSLGYIGSRTHAHTAPIVLHLFLILAMPRNVLSFSTIWINVCGCDHKELQLMSHHSTKQCVATIPFWMLKSVTLNRHKDTCNWGQMERNWILSLLFPAVIKTNT